MDRKPLGIKSYGQIPHLPNSRATPSDKHCHEGQERIATIKARDRHDEVIVTEKVDGSNVGVALVSGCIIAITRAGYLARTSPYEQHWHWADWVDANASRFRYVLRENGERVCGEWLMQAHGTRYELSHEPFVAFDIMKEHHRIPYDDCLLRLNQGHFITPHLIHRGQPISVKAVLERLGDNGFHGAIDEVEGAVWRVQSRGEVDFLVKYVKPYKVDGVYLPERSGKPSIWNWYYTNPELTLISDEELRNVLYKTEWEVIDHNRIQYPRTTMKVHALYVNNNMYGFVLDKPEEKDWFSVYVGDREYAHSTTAKHTLDEAKAFLLDCATVNMRLPDKHDEVAQAQLQHNKEELGGKHE